MALSGIEVEIYKDSDPFNKLGVIEARQRPTVLREIQGVGAGSFQVSKNNKKILEDPTLLEYRNFVRIRQNGKVVGGFIMGTKKHTIVGEGEKAEEVWSISGEGLRSWGNDAKVRPAKGVTTNSRETRYFNFATEQGAWYNASQWVPATMGWTVHNRSGGGTWNPWKTAPADWPDAPTARWIWDRSAATSPKGYVYFRREFTVAAGQEGQYSLFFAVDDQAEVYLDGELLHTTAEHAWQETTRQDFDLEAGTHVIALKAYNYANTGPAGLVAAFYKVGNANTPTAASRIFVSDSSWKVCGYPTVAPGWTPGNILLTLLNEAKNRGIRFANNWTTTFTNTHDSAGVPWGDPISISFDVGTSYEEVFEALEESACDIYLDPDTLALSAWKKRGVDRSVENPDTAVEPVILRVGHNLRTADEAGQADIVNTLILKTADGWKVVQPTDTTSVTKYGVLEGQLSTEMSEAQATSLVDEVFGKKSLPEKTATFELIPVPGMVPFEDFVEGDYVSAPGEVPGVLEKRRVMSIAISENESTGEPIYAIEFDAIFSDRTDDLAKLLSKTAHASSLGAGFPGASGTPQTPTQGTGPKLPISVPPASPTGLAVTTAGRWADSGFAVSDYSLSWNPVITNVDGDELSDVESYEVWGRKTAQESYARLVTVFDSFASLPNYTPGESWDFQVRAISRTGGAGDFTDPVTLVAASPNVPLGAPSKPTLVSDLGTVGVRWDGLIGGQQPPSRYKFMEIQRSTTENGTYTVVGSFVAGSGIDSTGVVGTLYWYRIVPVDYLGVRGTPSAAASITVVGVSTGDLDEAIEEAIGGIRARGNDLVTNGNAILGNNKNFSGWNLEVGDQPPGTYGAFSYQSGTTGWPRFTDELISIDPNKFYLPSIKVKQVNVGVTSRFYFGLVPYDVDGLIVAPENYIEQPNTRTTLAATLNPGDTTVQLTSAANWNNSAGANSYQRKILFWDYVDGKGKLWAPGTYTRHMIGTDAYADGGIVGNTITLRVPYAGPAVPAGTQVSNGTSGGNYMYAIGMSNALVPSDGNWQTYTAAQPYGGLMPPNSIAAATTAFPIATAAVKIVILGNYGVSGGTSKQLFAGFSLSDVQAAQFRADSADGRITISGSIPAVADGAGKPVGALWWRQVAGKVVGLWEWSGSAWIARELDATFIPQINIGTGTFGDLTGARLSVGSVSAQKMLIANLDNQLDNPNFETNSFLGWEQTGSTVGWAVANASSQDSINKYLYRQSTAANPVGQITNGFRVGVRPQNRVRIDALSQCSGIAPGPWTTQRRNYFPDPLAVSIASFSSPAVGDYSSISDMPGTVATALRWTRTATGTGRIAMPVGTTMFRSANGRIRIRARASEAMSAAVMVRTDPTSTTGSSTVAASVTIPAGVSEIDVTGPVGTAAATATTGVVLEITGGAVGATLDLTNISVETTASAALGAPLNGSLMTTSDLEQYLWEGTPNASQSVFQTRTAASSIGVQFYDAAGGALSYVPKALDSTVNWTAISWETDVPPNAYFASLRVVDAGTANTTLRLANMQFRIMGAGQLLVDGTIEGRHVKAKSFTGEVFQAGSIEVDALSPNVGSTISLNGNVDINVIQDTLSAQADALAAQQQTGDAVNDAALAAAQAAAEAAQAAQLAQYQANGLQAGIENTQANLSSLGRTYRFTENGAFVGAPGSPYEFVIQNNGAEIRYNGVPVSSWDSGRMIVDSFVGNEVVLGNHKLEKDDGTFGTVVRKIVSN